MSPVGLGCVISDRRRRAATAATATAAATAARRDHHHPRHRRRRAAAALLHARHAGLLADAIVVLLALRLKRGGREHGDLLALPSRR